MKKIPLAVLCMLAATVNGCGGGGGETPADTTATAARAEVATRATKQGDEREYQIAEKYNDDATLTYNRRTVQTSLNADRSGERQTFDLKNALVQSLRYDAKGIRTVISYPSEVSCSPNVALNSFPDRLIIGQTIENNYTDSCSNGYSYKIEEKATVTATEPVEVNGTTYNAVKETATLSVEVTPPAPGENRKYTVTDTIWIDPVLGVTVKETTDLTYPNPPPGHYLVSTTRTLVSYVNK